VKRRLARRAAFTAEVLEMKSFFSARFTAFIAAAALLLLSGCASTYTLDNTVQSFSQLTALPAPATYRFERLPSQQEPSQAQLEALADAALNQAGLKRDDANPRYSVQVSARVQLEVSPWADPWDRGWGWGGGFGWRHRHWGMGFGVGSAFDSPPWYHREVNVIVRDLAANRVVFETRAINDGPWRESIHVLPAMFQAAMQGFPNPPPGPRTVNIELATR
jgi:hypothetical protein